MQEKKEAVVKSGRTKLRKRSDNPKLKAIPHKDRL